MARGAVIGVPSGKSPELLLKVIRQFTDCELIMNAGDVWFNSRIGVFSIDLMNSFQASSASLPDEDWVQQMDPDQMFALIDRLLPFEACLYYQVLPLSLDGSRLNLGMVDPEDTAASDYVRRLLSYINCSIVPRPISSAAHREMLSQYLGRAGKQSQSSSPQPTAASPAAAPKTPAPTPPPPKPPSSERNLQTTLIVDSPEELDLAEMQPISSQPRTPPAIPSISSKPTAGSENHSNRALPSNRPFTKEAARNPNHRSTKPSAPEPTSPPEEGSPTHPPTLELSVHHLSSPVEALIKLPPRSLLHELLGRVLVSGIGRLYFEQQRDAGRILWSQNGVMQSVLEQLDPALFQSVLNELKRLMGLPLLPVKDVKQVELERRYRGTHILLRLRVMPGTHGEEATLQVLRGAALKFYQQQLISNLGRDALTLAQKLQQRIHEIRDRARSELQLSNSQIESLPALRELLHQLDEQVQELMEKQAQDSDK